MPIVEIKNDAAPTASVRCVACSKVTDLALAGLQLGASAQAVDQIVLPPCACGAQEFLSRTFDGADDAHAGHRKAVNAVAIYLKGAGKVHSAAASALAADTRTPKLVRPLIGPVLVAA